MPKSRQAYRPERSWSSQVWLTICSGTMMPIATAIKAGTNEVSES